MAGFGFGFGFALARRPRLMSGPPALGALAIQGATAMTDGIDGNGWIVKVTLPSALIGQAADATRLTLTWLEPGFDGTGSPITVARSSTGGAQLRQAAPNDASRIEAQSGADAIIPFTLFKRIGAAATLVSASVTAGLYGSSSAGALSVNTGAGASGSGLAYAKGTGGWFTPQFCNPQGTHFNVEFAAIHHEAKSGRTYACVEFRVETMAGVDQGISVKVSTMTESVHTTSASPAPCYAAAIPMSGLTQGTRYIVRAKAYPWIGDSSAILDTGAPADPTSARPLTSLTFVCDKNGSYGDVVAFVKNGVTGGTVGNASNLAGARATPFPNRATAAAAIKTANNAKSGGDQHNDAGGGTIYYMEDSAGAGADHPGMGANTMAASTAGAVAWLNHRVDPDATGTVRLVTGSQKNPGRCSRFIDLPIAQGTVAGNINDYIILDSGDSSAGNLVPIWLDGCTHVAAATNTAASPFARFGLGYVTRGSYSGMGLMFFAPVGNVRSQLALCLGATITGFKSYPFILAGCVFPSGATVDVWSGVTVVDHNDGALVLFNQFQNQAVSFNLATTGTYSYVAFAGNLVEIINNGVNAGVFIGGDNHASNINAGVIMSNTIVGERCNFNYTSSGIGVSTVKKLIDRDNIFEWRNTKSDKFYVTSGGGASGVGRTGNFESRYGVDCRNNVVRVGGSDSAAPGSGGWIGEAVVEPGSKLQSAAITFVSDMSKNHGGTGGGNYRPTGATNDAYGRIPANESAWPFDLARVARLNDGTGAAGAFER